MWAGNFPAQKLRADVYNTDEFGHTQKAKFAKGVNKKNILKKWWVCGPFLYFIYPLQEIWVALHR